jgi:hypothetical protein
MLHVVTLFSVPAENADTFIRSIRIGGAWHTLARRLAPGLIATDLLEHHAFSTLFLYNSSHLYLALDFWTSPEAHFRACLSAECQSLLLARRQMASASFELGTFTFPSVMEPHDLAEHSAVRH